MFLMEGYYLNQILDIKEPVPPLPFPSPTSAHVVLK